MSSRSHRWEAGRTPLSDHHGGTAAAARAAIKASRIEKHQQFQKAREIVVRQMAERTCAPVENSPSGFRRVRPRARLSQASRWNCRRTRHLPHDRQGDECWFPKNQAEAENRRKILIVAQGGLCALCGAELSEERDRPLLTLRPSVDHVIPRMLGGSNRFNLVAAHNQCNSDKSNDIPTGCEVVWLLVVNARMRQLPPEMQAAFYR